VLYFHSPATGGEELEGDAEEAADELGIQLLAVVRPSVAEDRAQGSFIATVASDAALVVDALDLGLVVVLGWSGGAPYALAACARIGSVISAVHLVSPVPGPLIGPGAVADQSDRLREIAATSPTSSWVARPGTFRDYQAVAAPWPFDIRSVGQPVTIWAPVEDEIVPPRLIDHLASQLPRVETVKVPGAHGWIMENWSTVLRRVATA
jgi:pimeloyl-ACP methyl ester carboxylesterase